MTGAVETGGEGIRDGGGGAFRTSWAVVILDVDISGVIAGEDVPAFELTTATAKPTWLTPLLITAIISSFSSSSQALVDISEVGTDEDEGAMLKLLGMKRL